MRNFLSLALVIFAVSPAFAADSPEGVPQMHRCKAEDLSGTWKLVTLVENNQIIKGREEDLLFEKNKIKFVFLTDKMPAWKKLQKKWMSKNYPYTLDRRGVITVQRDKGKKSFFRCEYFDQDAGPEVPEDMRPKKGDIFLTQYDKDGKGVHSVRLMRKK